MMKNIIFLTIVVILSPTAFAQNPGNNIGLKILTYTTDRFQEVNIRDNIAILHFISDKCSTCRAQYSYLRSLKNNSTYRNFTALQINITRTPKLASDFAVQSPSTLIVLHSGTETGRSINESNPIQIWALLETASGRGDADRFDFYRLPVSEKRLFLIKAFEPLRGRGNNFYNIYHYLANNPEVVNQPYFDKEADEVWGIIYQLLKGSQQDKDAFNLIKQRMQVLSTAEHEGFPELHSNPLSGKTK